MKTPLLRIFGCIIPGIALAFSLQALNPSQDPAIAAIAASPQFQTFLGNLRSALNSQDAAALKACFHPKSLAIVNADPKTGQKFAKRFANPIPNECKVFITAIAPGTELPFANMGVKFPVRPSHQVQVTFNSGEGKPTALVLFVILEKGKWYEVVPATPST